MISQLKDKMRDFRDLLISLAAIVSVILAALAYFTPASAFKEHIANDDIEKLSTQRWEASKQMAYCVRQLEEYSNLTIMETQTCEDSEQMYIFTSERLCSKYKMFCKE